MKAILNLVMMNMPPDTKQKTHFMEIADLNDLIKVKNTEFPFL